MEKTRVLWVDHYYRDDIIALREANFELHYPRTTARLVNTYDKLISLANSGDLGKFDVLVGHMSFDGLTDFVMRYQEDLSHLRLGILTDENVNIELEAEVIEEFSPDFLANFDDGDFVKEQFVKGRITEREREFRGRTVLTPMTDIDPEGKPTGNERHDDFAPQRTVRREREGD